MKEKTRIGFCGSRPLSFKILRWLAKKKNVKIVGVVGNKKNRHKWWKGTLKELAKELNLPVKTHKELLKEKPELVIIINYLTIFKKEEIEKVPLGIINMHHSFNSRFRGRWPCYYARLYAKRDRYWKHGTTMHFIDERIDQGRVVKTESFKIRKEDTVWTLYRKCDKLAFKLFKENFDKVLKGNVETTEPSRKSYIFTEGDVNEHTIEELDEERRKRKRK